MAVNIRLACAGDPLGGGRGGFRAVIRGKIAQGKINFMAHRGYDGNGGCRHRAGDNFLVERPEVLNAAAAATDNQQVAQVVKVGQLDSIHNFLGGTSPLYPGGDHHQVATPRAAPQDRDEIPQRCPAVGCHEADGCRQSRQAALAGGIKQALRRELFLQFEECLLQAPDAVLLDNPENDLVTAARLVDGNPSGADNLQAVAQPHFQAFGIRAETDSGNRGIPVLQRKINVSGLLPAQVADLATQSHHREIRLQQLLDLPGQLGDRQGRGFTGALRDHGSGVCGCNRKRGLTG